jgi:hypothetical protein
MSENNLTGQIGELRMTIEIKRAATGETEIHELIGTPIESDEDEQEDSE